MNSDNASRRKAFLARMLAAKTMSPTFAEALWASRGVIGQWFLVFAALAICSGYLFGHASVPCVVAVEGGVLLGFVLVLGSSVERWPWLVAIVDWEKVQREMSKDQESGA